jgi:3-phenylpropionate/cinnamic acid dioxygenase small subunit
MTAAVSIDTLAVGRMLDEHAIAKVVYRYCRGIDRRDFDAVRDCYHSDATDDHGPFDGGVEEFVEWCKGVLADFTGTMHFIGNVLVDIDEDDPDVARSEAYAVTYHRIAARGDRPERDYVVAVRYVDRFERRNGRWAIAVRRCSLDWCRMDPVGYCPPFGPGSTLGVAGRDDVVFASF